MQKRKKKIMITWLIIGGIVTTIYAGAFIFGIVSLIGGPALFHLDRYKGEHPHLYTVAVNSLLTQGRISYIESYSASEIIKVDEDDYGRELFIYYGSSLGNSAEAAGIRSVLICQKHDKNLAYWYDSDNFVLSRSFSRQEILENGVNNDPYRGITAEQIEELKTINDWGKEIDESKLSSAKIVRDPLRRSGSRAEEAKAKSFYNGLFEESGYDYNWCQYLLQDKDGRAIFYMSGKNYELDYKSEYKYKYIIAITSPEGEFYEGGWFIFESTKIYAESLKSIKEATGWNMEA